jgi:hypothetical protein
MAAIVFACGLAACANYRAVGEFGARTEELTQVVRQEVKQVDALCVEQAELNALLSDDAGESALKDCAAYQAAQSRFAGMTLDVLDNYARALKAIADGSRFDLDPELDNLSGKLQGLAANGQPLVGAAERTALSQVAKILADLVTTRKRDQAVRRLVSETPNLATTGNILRRYFAGPASPYQNIVGIIGETASSNARLLKQARVREAEPIRTAELSRAARDGRQMLEARNSSAADGVRAQMAAAIDAWQSALQSFAKQALEPDPRELGDRLKELRKRVKVAYRAIEGNGQ